MTAGGDAGGRTRICAGDWGAGGMGEEDHQLAKQASGLDSGQVILWKSCQRRTAICLLAYIYLAIAVAVQRRQEAGSDLDAGPIPITVPELLRLLRDAVIPASRRDQPHRLPLGRWIPKAAPADSEPRAGQRGRTPMMVSFRPPRNRPASSVRVLSTREG